MPAGSKRIGHIAPEIGSSAPRAPGSLLRPARAPVRQCVHSLQCHTPPRLKRLSRPPQTILVWLTPWFNFSHAVFPISEFQPSGFQPFISPPNSHLQSPGFCFLLSKFQHSPAAFNSCSANPRAGRGWSAVWLFATRIPKMKTTVAGRHTVLDSRLPSNTL